MVVPVAMETEVEVGVEKEKSVQGEAMALVEQARGLDVKSIEDLEYCRDFLTDIKDFLKKADTIVGEIKRSAYAHYKKAGEKEKQVIGGAQEANRIVRDKMGAWKSAQDALRAEEERKERLRLQKAKDAALRRAQAAAAKLVEGAGGLEVAISKLNDELCNPNLTELEECALKAERAAVQGRLDAIAERIERKHEAIEEIPETYLTPIVSVPKVDKVSYRTVYIVKVVNPKAALKAVLEGLIPLEAITFQEATLKKLAKMKMPMPGVRVESKQVPVYR